VFVEYDETGAMRRMSRFGNGVQTGCFSVKSHYSFFIFGGVSSSAAHIWE